jgi:hypothetical protein
LKKQFQVKAIEAPVATTTVEAGPFPRTMPLPGRTELKALTVTATIGVITRLMSMISVLVPRQIQIKARYHENVKMKKKRAFIKISLFSYSEGKECWEPQHKSICPPVLQRTKMTENAG